MRTLKNFLSCLCLSVLCSACANQVPSASFLNDIAISELDPSIAERAPESIIEPYVTAGLGQLHKGNYDEAGEQFRHALALEPQNVAVNFLNALTYHARGSRGDSQQFELASVGYEVALRFDPQAWWAAYYYGALELERRRYLKAQDLFAQAIDLRPNEAQPLLGLAIASYYVGDLETAAAAIRRAQDVSPNKAPLVRASALISAAIGDDQSARDFVELYQDTSTHPLQLAQLQTRVDEWQRVYAQAQMDTSAQEQTPSPVTAPTPVAETDATETAGPRQIVIEASVVRSVRSTQRRRGINILDGLAAQFSYSNTKTTNWVTGAEKDVAKTVTRAMGIPELNYSLNIFNTSTSRTEIIARPTLLATEGAPSTFFSGELFIASIQGTLDGTAFSERVGVNVSVTPVFLSNDEFLLDITLADSDFTSGTLPGTFEEAISVSTAESKVTARVRIGQTLLLAGLTERQGVRSENKVPFFGDLPIIQTIFSEKNLDEEVTETLILLTPRRAIDVNEPLEPVSAPAGEKGLRRVEELRRSYLQAFAPQTNYRHLLFHLSDSTYYQQFRRGDLRLEVWEGRVGSERLWDDILAYFYF